MTVFSKFMCTVGFLFNKFLTSSTPQQSKSCFSKPELLWITVLMHPIALRPIFKMQFIILGGLMKECHGAVLTAIKISRPKKRCNAIIATFNTETIAKSLHWGYIDPYSIFVNQNICYFFGISYCWRRFMSVENVNNQMASKGRRECSQGLLLLKKKQSSRQITFNFLPITEGKNSSGK